MGRALPGPLLAVFAFSAIGGPLALTARFVAYLRFRSRPSLVDWAAAVVATVLMGFGPWIVISQQPYT